MSANRAALNYPMICVHSGSRKRPKMPSFMTGYSLWRPACIFLKWTLEIPFFPLIGMCFDPKQLLQHRFEFRPVSFQVVYGVIQGQKQVERRGRTLVDHQIVPVVAYSLNQDWSSAHTLNKSLILSSMIIERPASALLQTSQHSSK